jgi:hypothetical protein
MLGPLTTSGAQRVFADVAKNVYDKWSRSSMIARVASSVMAGVVGIVGVAAISSKASHFFNKSKVTIESSKSEEQTLTKRPKISRYKQIKRKASAFGQSIIAGVKARPYRAAVMVGAFSTAAVLVGANLRVRNHLEITPNRVEPTLDLSHAKDQSTAPLDPGSRKKDFAGLSGLSNNAEKKFIKVVDTSLAFRRKMASGVSTFYSKNRGRFSDIGSTALWKYLTSNLRTGKAATKADVVEQVVIASVIGSVLGVYLATYRVLHRVLEAAVKQVARALLHMANC